MRSKSTISGKVDTAKPPIYKNGKLVGGHCIKLAWGVFTVKYDSNARRVTQNGLSFPPIPSSAEKVERGESFGEIHPYDI